VWIDIEQLLAEDDMGRIAIRQYEHPYPITVGPVTQAHAEDCPQRIP
jgi:hypothetical protein